MSREQAKSVLRFSPFFLFSMREKREERRGNKLTIALISKKEMREKRREQTTFPSHLKERDEKREERERKLHFTPLHNERREERSEEREKTRLHSEVKRDTVLILLTNVGKG